jgi:hypothetical protein
MRRSAAAWPVLLTSAVVILSSCGPGDSGTDTGTSTATTSAGSTAAVPTSGGEVTGGAAGCAILDCAACTECQRDGECNNLYTLCSEDTSCIDYVDCLIPTCLEQGMLGEAYAEMCMGMGDPLKGAAYVDCVTEVCDPACGFGT